MKKIISLITILITFVASYGQLDKDSILIAKIVKSGISIGKSFNGTSADETQPANFFWYKDLNDNYYYSLIDLKESCLLILNQIENLYHSNPNHYCFSYFNFSRFSFSCFKLLEECKLVCFAMI